MMTDEPGLADRVLKELERTGYPTEIMAASFLEQQQWGVIHNPTYLDESEQISREYDVRAYKGVEREAGGRRLVLGIYLILECKKSDKPWVFFTTSTDQNIKKGHRLGKLIQSPYDHNRHIFWSEYAGQPSIISDDDWRSFHHYFQQERWARTYYEPFKGQDKSDTSPMIYGAVSSATKAVMFNLTEQGLSNEWVPIYYPVIVFDGNLFDARVHGKEETELVASDHIVLKHQYTTPSTRAHRRGSNVHEFLVDVVREPFFAEYIDLIQREYEILAEMLRLPLGQGKLEKSP